MGYTYHPKLAPALRAVAQRYFDNDPEHFGALGICGNLDAPAGVSLWGLAELFMALGMDRSNPFGPELGDYDPEASPWEPRAYMALLLAEVIEQSREGS